ATERYNTMEGPLILVLLLAAWATLHAVRTGRARWLLISLGLAGLGFNLKMLQAFLVLPAFYLPYLLAAPVPFVRRLLHLAAASRDHRPATPPHRPRRHAHRAPGPPRGPLARR